MRLRPARKDRGRGPAGAASRQRIAGRDYEAVRGAPRRLGLDAGRVELGPDHVSRRAEPVGAQRQRGRGVVESHPSFRGGESNPIEPPLDQPLGMRVGDAEIGDAAARSSASAGRGGSGRACRCRRVERSTALTNPEALGFRAPRVRSTASSTTAAAGTRSRCRIWYRPMRRMVTMSGRVSSGCVWRSGRSDGRGCAAIAASR